MLNEISKQVYEANKLKGFDVKNENLGQTLMLIVSEVSEALEAIRKNKRCNLTKKVNGSPLNNVIQGFMITPLSHEKESQKYKLIFEKNVKDTFEDEIADTFIRLFDLCGALDIDIDRHIELKRRYNSQRQFKHGKAF